MSGSQVRELAQSGMEIGSHSLTHPFLTELNDAELEIEIRDSKAFLEDLVGSKVECFSYPFGDVDARVREATMRAGYRIGCGTQRGPNLFSADWLMLRRSAVYGRDRLEGLLRILLRRSPNWRESAAELLKQTLGTRRYRAWRGYLARRGRS
jgi:peptidoglycan/xylan/chitin deacetylase (PgdA/CDA1 family)